MKGGPSESQETYRKRETVIDRDRERDNERQRGRDIETNSRQIDQKDNETQKNAETEELLF